MRCDLNNSNSGHCSLCCPSHHYVFQHSVSDSIAMRKVALPLCHDTENRLDNTQPEIKPIIHTWLGKLGSRMQLTFLSGNICDVWLHDTHITRRQFNGTLLLQGPGQKRFLHLLNNLKHTGLTTIVITDTT